MDEIDNILNNVDEKRNKNNKDDNNLKFLEKELYEEKEYETYKKDKSNDNKICIRLIKK